MFDPATGLSTISNTLSVTGTYFALTEFLFSIETLPRAAKVTSVSLVPGEEGGTLTLSAGVDVYTSDTSAGPGSSPGPTSGATGSDHHSDHAGRHEHARPRSRPRKADGCHSTIAIAGP